MTGRNIEITVDTLRGGRACLLVSADETVGDVALRAAGLLEQRVGARDSATLAFGEIGLHPSDRMGQLAERNFQLVIVGGVV